MWPGNKEGTLGYDERHGWDKKCRLDGWGDSNSHWLTAASLGVDEWVINADGELWVLPYTLSPLDRSSSRKKLWYKDNGNSCDWM